MLILLYMCRTEKTVNNKSVVWHFYRRCTQELSTLSLFFCVDFNHMYCIFLQTISVISIHGSTSGARLPIDVYQNRGCAMGYQIAFTTTDLMKSIVHE